MKWGTRLGQTKRNIDKMITRDDAPMCWNLELDWVRSDGPYTKCCYRGGDKVSCIDI